MLKKGKMPTADRYKKLVKKRLEENKQKAIFGDKRKGFSLKGTFSLSKTMSRRTEQTLKEIAERKARKQAAAERKMVIVQPRNFHNGYLNKKGQFYDVAGNMVGTVNVKNGRIATTTSVPLGRYKPKSYFSELVIQDAINKYSPYFIKQRQLQALQQQGVQAYGVHGVAPPEVINLYGGYAPSAMTEGDGYSPYGTDVEAPRQNVGVTAWGAMSSNTWGTYADNAWGTMSDNVWGSSYSNVWGGVGGEGMWGQKGIKVWGTGTGSNYIKGITNFILGLLGISSKKNRDRLRALDRAGRASSPGPRAPSASTARSAPSAPTRGR